MARLIYLSTLIFSFLTLSSADDAAVMAKLLASFGTAPSGWSNTTDYCGWKDVICDRSNRVTIITLVSQSLTGTLPSDLGTLTRLTIFFSPKPLTLWTDPLPCRPHFSPMPLP